MTTAEQLISQGVSQGYDQGVVNTQINLIKKAYLNGMTTNMIVNIFDLPLEKVEEIIAKVKSGLI